MTSLKEYLKNDLEKLTSPAILGGTIMTIVIANFLNSKDFLINLLNTSLAIMGAFILYIFIRSTFFFLFVFKKRKKSTTHTKIKDMDCFTPILNLILKNSPNATSGNDIKIQLKIPYKKFNKVVYYLKEKKAIKIQYPSKSMIEEYYLIWVVDTDKMEKFLE